MHPHVLPVARQMKAPGAALSVPSPLAGEGQEGGCHTARSIRLVKNRLTQEGAPFPGLPPSPALPHKGGGSAPVASLGLPFLSRAGLPTKLLVTEVLP